MKTVKFKDLQFAPIDRLQEAYFTNGKYYGHVYRNIVNSKCMIIVNGGDEGCVVLAVNIEEKEVTRILNMSHEDFHFAVINYGTHKLPQ